MVVTSSESKFPLFDLLAVVTFVVFIEITALLSQI